MCNGKYDRPSIEIYEFIQKEMEAGHAMTVTTHESIENKYQGIYGKHAYAVTNVHIDDLGNRYIICIIPGGIHRGRLPGILKGLVW
ncbi:hypothetical protein AQUSIP_06420 [Aquicella siphonis]|uniref:Uncharacterized protein n=1 Tax=Aquicella siphonis TaxID=254247 RepID=A0A5E4PFQ8_9COXI|nr:hypothetical protein AQUSIP_06420 [Aquicella siphonis]